MRFVIIGGDAAGMSAASRAKRNNPELEVIVLEQGSDVSYSACNIPYNIAVPERSIDDLVVRSADAFRQNQKIDLRTSHRVESINPKEKTIAGTVADNSSFSLRYDRLLIATGASPIRPEIEGINLPGVFVVKNLEDGRSIKDFLKSRQVRRCVIIGMGYIALEMAEALSEQAIAIDMIKPREGLLPWLDEKLSFQVRNHLEEQGVGLHDGHRLKKILQEGEQLQVIAEDIQLDCDMVVVAIGVSPNAELAKLAGLELSVAGSIAVDHQLRTSDVDIFAAGDCADSYHLVTGEKTWVPLALRANRAGWAVADTVCGRPVRLAGIAGTAVFKTFDMQVTRSGLTVDEAQAAGFAPVAVQISSKSRAGIYPGAQPIHVAMVGDRTTGLLLGAQAVGTDQVAHRINAVAIALQAKMSVLDFAQSDLAYAPPFGPTWDPLLIAANQLLKKLLNP